MAQRPRTTTGLAAILATAVFLCASPPAAQADHSRSELVRVVEQGMGLAFLLPPPVLEVSPRALCQAIAAELRQCPPRGMAGQDRAEQARAAGAALGRVLPVWFDLFGNRVLVCPDNAARLWTRASGDGPVTEGATRLLALYGLVQGLDSYRYNFPVTAGWLGTEEERQVFDGLRWGHAWLHAARLGRDLGLAGEIRVWARAFDVILSPQESAGSGASGYPKEVARYSRLFISGRRFCSRAADQDGGLWLVGLLARPFLPLACLEDPGRCDFRKTIPGTRTGAEWALQLVMHNVDPRLRCHVVRQGEAALTGKVEGNGRTGRSGVLVHRLLTMAPHKDSFARCVAAFTVFDSLGGSRDHFKQRGIKYKGRRRAWIKQGFRVRKSHKDNICGREWRGTLETHLLKGRDGRTGCQGLLVRSKCAVLDILYQGDRRSSEVIEALCDQVFRAHAAGGAASPSGGVVFSGSGWGISLDQFRKIGGLDFITPMWDHDRALAVMKSCLQLYGINLAEYELTSFDLTRGLSCSVHYSLPMPRPPGGFFHADLDFTKGVFHHMPGM